jgi:hypothetical protein
MEADSKTVSRPGLRMLLVAVIALLVGAAFSPMVVSAAASLQGVLVKNTSSSAVFVQPQNRTPVRLMVGNTIGVGAGGASGVLYNVPAGKWLVVTSITVNGWGIDGQPPSLGPTEALASPVS